MKPPARRPARESLRDIKLRNQKSLDLYAALSGKPRIVIDIPPAPAPRAPKPPAAQDAAQTAALAGEPINLHVAPPSAPLP